MNKYEQLIDRLADKTLSFGCGIKLAGEVYTYIRSEVGGCYVVEEEHLLTIKPQHCEIIGHSVTIGRVLEKLYEVCEGNEDHLLVDLWAKCGINKSLNEIYEESGVGETKWREPNLDGSMNTGPIYALKSPNAEALFNFLIELFLN